MRAVLAAILAAACLGSVHAEEPKAAPKLPPPTFPGLAGFGWFADLAGSCWSGVRPDKVTTDTHCYLPQYDRLMRGSFKATSGGNVEFEGDAVFALTGPKKAVYTQWGSGGAFATGELTIEGDTLTFQSKSIDGEPWEIRHVWRKAGPDGFRVTRERKEDSKWVEAFTQDFKRVAGR